MKYNDPMPTVWARKPGRVGFFNLIGYFPLKTEEQGS